MLIVSFNKRGFEKRLSNNLRAEGIGRKNSPLEWREKRKVEPLYKKKADKIVDDMPPPHLLHAINFIRRVGCFELWKFQVWSQGEAVAETRRRKHESEYVRASVCTPPLDDRFAENIHEARKLTGRQLVFRRFREVVAVYIRHTRLDSADRGNISFGSKRGEFRGEPRETNSPALHNPSFARYGNRRRGTKTRRD